MDPTYMTLAEVLRTLQGTALSSIEFVQDYVQFRFDGPQLTAYVWPTIQKGTCVIRRSDSGYCDALVQEIGKAVTKLTITLDKVEFRFEDEATLRIPLREPNFDGPEAFEFRDQGDGIWVG